MTTIVLIDDDQDLVASTSHVLERNGYTVIAATDGIEGLEYALNESPDLIICDIMLPHINGYEILAELRSRSETSAIPFIFLTALGTPDDVREGMARGADDYLPKPFRHAELLQAIHARLARQHAHEQRRLQHFAAHLVSLQEDRQREIAQYLHDQIEQSLASLKLSLSLDSLSTDQQILIDGLLDDIRGLASDVYPTLLERLGLVPGLSWLCKRFQARYGFRIDFQHSPLPHTPPYHNLLLFRILQDALSLLVQRAETLNVQVRLRRDAEALLVLDVEGPRAGFALEDVSGDLELVAIYERGAALGADVALSASRGGGFFLTVSVRLDDVTIPTTQPDLLDRLRRTGASETAGTTPVPVCLVEPNNYLQEGIRALLANDGRFYVAHACDNLVNCARHLRQQPASMVLANLFSGSNSPDALRTLRAEHPHLPLLVFAAPTDPAYIVEAFRAGADGYLPHLAPPRELPEALAQIGAGHAYLSPTISEVSPQAFVRDQEKYIRASEDVAYHRLTPREREIFKLIAEGNTNAAIAHLLTISVRTVEAHRANLMRKLNLSNQNDLFRLAVKVGVLQVDA